jgi:hypothetical protein
MSKEYDDHYDFDDPNEDNWEPFDDENEDKKNIIENKWEPFDKIEETKIKLKIKYKAIDFFNDIKTELAQLFPKKDIFNGKLKNKVLSRLFGVKDSHVKSKISDKTEISLEQLNSYLLNLKASLTQKGIELTKNLQHFFERYRSKNVLRKYTYGSVLDYHPDFKIRYFNEINTKEKAYWLGWLYAEGWMSSLVGGQGQRYIEWGVGCKEEGKFLINRFIESIGFNPDHLEFIQRKNFFRIRVSFSRMDFPNTLIRLGLKVGKKAYHIELPNLGKLESTRHLYLAFLIGFFDGDGTTGTSEINSASKKFLEDIKQKFCIENELRFAKNKKGGGWRLTLSAQLFNEMLDNYSLSLPNKRIRLELENERVERLRNFAQERLKFSYQKEKLEKLIWLMSYKEIALLHYRLFNQQVSESTVKSWIYKWKLKRPSRKQIKLIKQDGIRSLKELLKIYKSLDDS